MGLKILAEALIKHGKTLFALSMSEFGPIGFVDTEQRAQMYTRPATVEEVVAKCPWIKTATQEEKGVKYPLLKDGVLRVPFDMPRIMRDDMPAVNANPVMRAVIAAGNIIFVREVLDVVSIGATLEWFGKQHPNLYGQALDTITDVWDQLQEMKDPDPKKDRLAWATPKRFDRRIRWAARIGGGPCVITTHLKPEYEKRDGELVKIGTILSASKETPRWADVHIRLFLPDAVNGVPQPPKAGIVGEATGGVVTKGTVIEAVSFGKIARMLTWMPSVERAKAQDPGEAEYRTATAMRKLEGTPEGAADREPVADGRRGQ